MYMGYSTTVLNPPVSNWHILRLYTHTINSSLGLKASDG
jgi:hypothetical protein